MSEDYQILFELLLALCNVHRFINGSDNGLFIYIHSIIHPCG